MGLNYVSGTIFQQGWEVGYKDGSAANSSNNNTYWGLFGDSWQAGYQTGYDYGWMENNQKNPQSEEKTTNSMSPEEKFIQKYDTNGDNLLDANEFPNQSFQK